MKKSILKVVHDSAKGLHKAGFVDKATMHEFDILCMPTVRELAPKEIQRIREKVSQSVFSPF